MRETPPIATQWSTRSLAEAIGGSDTLVPRVSLDNGLKPHLTKTIKVSDAYRIAGVVLRPPPPRADGERDGERLGDHRELGLDPIPLAWMVNQMIWP